MAKAETRKPGEILVGDKVNTPEGEGTVETVKDDLIAGKLKNGKAFSYRPRYVSIPA